MAAATTPQLLAVPDNGRKRRLADDAHDAGRPLEVIQPAVRAARAGVTGVQAIMHDGVATHREVLGSSDPPVALAHLGLGTAGLTSALAFAAPASVLALAFAGLTAACSARPSSAARSASDASPAGGAAVADARSLV